MEENKNRQMGTVIFFSNPKCFGFIKMDSGEKDLFIHFSGIVAEGYRTLTPGDRVEFEIGSNHKGPCAINLAVIQKA